MAAHRHTIMVEKIKFYPEIQAELSPQKSIDQVFAGLFPH